MNKILSKWYIFIALIIVSTVSFCVAVNAKTSPKDNERISFFIGALDCKVDKLSNEINTNKEEQIKVINCNYHNINASNFTFIFSSFRENSDFFILPINYVKDNEGSVTKYSANIDKTYLDSQIGNNLEYVEYEGVAKGFKVYDSQAQSGMLKDYVTYTNDDYVSDYYLFFQFDSVNIGTLNSKTKTTNAFSVIKELMSR